MSRLGPRKEKPQFRIVVSMPSRRVFLEDLTYERVVLSVRCWRWKLKSQEDLVVSHSERNDVFRAEGSRHTHRALITTPFRMRTFILSGAAAIS